MLLLRCLRKNLRIFFLEIIRKDASSLSIERKFVNANEGKEKQRWTAGWLFLIIPVTTFGLGTWQIKRKSWKVNLIARINENINLEPVDLPADLSELQDKEYRPFRVKGTFMHEQEILLGPRQLILKSDSSNKMFAPPPESGYLVITPFKLSNRDLTILVNRGWIPMNSKSPESRKKGQIEGETELVGVLRFTEKIHPMAVKNKPNQGIWLFRDLKAMSQVTGSSTVFLDATKSSTVPGGPIGGQTRTSLRDEHLSYAATWYAISVTTLYIWIQKYKHYFRLK